MAYEIQYQVNDTSVACGRYFTYVRFRGQQRPKHEEDLRVSVDVVG